MSNAGKVLSNPGALWVAIKSLLGIETEYVKKIVIVMDAGKPPVIRITSLVRDKIPETVTQEFGVFEAKR